MTNIIAKASNNQVMTPMERAILRFGKSLLIGAFTSAGVVVTSAVATGAPINGTLIIASVTAAVVSLLQAIAKYFNAQGDSGVATALNLVSDSAKASYNNISLAGKPTIDKATTQQIALDPKALDEVYAELGKRLQDIIRGNAPAQAPAMVDVSHAGMPEAPIAPVTTPIVPDSVPAGVVFNATPKPEVQG